LLFSQDALDPYGIPGLSGIIDAGSLLVPDTVFNPGHLLNPSSLDVGVGIGHGIILVAN
jgi:hypothetical protein